MATAKISHPAGADRRGGGPERFQASLFLHMRQWTSEGNEGVRPYRFMFSARRLKSASGRKLWELTAVFDLEELLAIDVGGHAQRQFRAGIREAMCQAIAGELGCEASQIEFLAGEVQRAVPITRGRAL